jgi:hypothetical protein
MSKFVSYDALRGLAHYEDRTQGGNLQLHYRQDVEPILDLARIERNDGLADKAGRKQELFLYARIPPVVILELKYKHGVDIFKRGDMKKAMELINSEYPYCKTTDKVHRLRQ